MPQLTKIENAARRLRTIRTSRAVQQRWLDQLNERLSADLTRVARAEARIAALDNEVEEIVENLRAMGVKVDAPAEP
jgi:uncharacterized coiled-coil protein SlyX